MTLAVLCPGQGGQHAGMLDKLAGDAHAQAVLGHAADVLGGQWRSLLADPQALFLNRNAQPLLCLAQYAAWTALQDVLADATAVAGYSAGEVSAYACAGALDAGKLARVAAERARLMDEQGQAGALLALQGMTRDAVERLCAVHGGHLAIAIDDDAHVAGGAPGTVQAMAQAAAESGAQVTCLKVGVPSHTPLMRAAIDPLAAVLRNAMGATLQKTVIAGISAERIGSREHAIETLSRQVAETIEWSACMDALYERGCRVFIELGPGSALSRMLARRHPDVRVRSLEDFHTLAGARAWLSRAMDDMHR